MRAFAEAVQAVGDEMGSKSLVAALPMRLLFSMQKMKRVSLSWTIRPAAFGGLELVGLEEVVDLLEDPHLIQRGVQGAGAAFCKIEVVSEVGDVDGENGKR